MLEVTSNNLSTNSPQIVILSLGVADETPYGFDQTAVFKGYNGETSARVYTFNFSGHTSTIYFDNAFYVNLTSSTTSFSQYALHVGKVWRLKQ